MTARRRGWILAAGLAAVTTVALLQRLAGLAPPSLAMDDQWVAALVMHASPGDLLELRAPTPVGFVLALKVLARLLGTDAWALQIAPFALGLATIPLLGWVAYRLTNLVPAGLAAAALLAGSRTHAVYSLRVKHFAVEGFAVLVLIAIAASFLRRPRASAFAALLGAALLALTVSYAAAGVALIVVNGLLLRAFLVRGEPAAPSRRAIAGGALAFDALAGAWLALVAARPRGASLTRFWRDDFLPLGDAHAAWTFLSTNVTRLLTGPLPDTLWWLALALPLAAGLLVARRSTRAGGIALIAFYGGLLAASALHLYPIGGRRTDLFTYPVTILALTGAIGALGRPRRVVALLALALVLLDMALFFPRPPVAYPASAARGAVERANDLAQAPDGLVIAPHATWAMACYGRWPVRLVRDASWTNGFSVEVNRPRTLVLRQTVEGVDYRLDPGVVREQLDAFLPGAPARVLRLSLGNLPETDEWIADVFARHGYAARARGSGDDETLVEFVRERTGD